MPGKNKPLRVPIASDSMSNNHEPTVQFAVIELQDAGDHIKKLKGISLATKHLMDLVGDQLQGLSATIPLLRGSEIVCVLIYPFILAIPERCCRLKS